MSISYFSCYLYLDKRSKGRSTKVCEFFDMSQANDSPDTGYHQTPWTAQRELFTKTLALYTSLKEFGCAFITDEFQSADENNSSTDTSDLMDSEIKMCKGRLILKNTEAGQNIIECVQNNS